MQLCRKKWTSEIDRVITQFPQQVISDIIFDYCNYVLTFDYTHPQVLAEAKILASEKKVSVLKYSQPWLFVPLRLTLNEPQTWRLQVTGRHSSVLLFELGKKDHITIKSLLRTFRRIYFDPNDSFIWSANLVCTICARGPEMLELHVEDENPKAAVVVTPLYQESIQYDPSHCHDLCLMIGVGYCEQTVEIMEP
jgi:hypothetical protein